MKNERGEPISRYDWMHSRIAERDHEIVSAVFTSKTGWALGFDNEQWRTLRMFAEMQFAPNEYVTRETLGKLHAHLQEGGGWLMETFDKLVPRVTDQRAKQREVIKRMENFK